MSVRRDSDQPLTHGPMNRNLSNSDIETEYELKKKSIYSQKVYDSFKTFGNFRCLIEKDHIFPSENLVRKTPKYQLPKDRIDLEDLDSIIKWFSQFRNTARACNLTKQECLSALISAIKDEDRLIQDGISLYHTTCLLQLMLVLVKINFSMISIGMYKRELGDRRNYQVVGTNHRKVFINSFNRYYVVSLANNQKNKVSVIDCFQIFASDLGPQATKSFLKANPDYLSFSIKELTDELYGITSREVDKLFDDYVEPTHPVLAVEKVKEEKKTVQCYCCGESGHIKSNCRHQKNTCDNCGKRGHLPIVCRGVATRDKKGKLRAVTTFKKNAVVHETLNTDTTRNIIDQVKDFMDKCAGDLDKKKEYAQKQSEKKREEQNKTEISKALQTKVAVIESQESAMKELLAEMAKMKEEIKLLKETNKEVVVRRRTESIDYISNVHKTEPELLEVTIDDIPVVAQADTGASVCVAPTRIAQELKLEIDYAIPPVTLSFIAFNTTAQLTKPVILFCPSTNMEVTTRIHVTESKIPYMLLPRGILKKDWTNKFLYKEITRTNIC